MPPQNELVRNRPLSGEELKRIILKDVDAILSKDGMYSLTIGYFRVSYRVQIVMHLDNPAYPVHTAVISSHPASKGEIANDPPLAALEPTPPLVDPSDEDAVVGEERAREIDSSNHARLEHNLPLTVDVKDHETGAMVEKQVLYDNANLPPAGSVEDKDIGVETAAEWKLPRRSVKDRKK